MGGGNGHGLRVVFVRQVFDANGAVESVEQPPVQNSNDLH